jgi:gentisate 1,2-dioxygenase
MPIISAPVRLLPAGFATQPRRATDGTIFVVVKGSGSAIIDGKTIALTPRTIVVAPSWRSAEFKADSQLVLFGFSDKTAQEKLHLHKKECA